MDLMDPFRMCAVCLQDGFRAMQTSFETFFFFPCGKMLKNLT